MFVKFSMPRLPVDGTAIKGADVLLSTYETTERMVFDPPHELVGKGAGSKVYARTSHTKGEMFGLKFWENFYVLGQNNPGEDTFRFVYYNGKTRQNTYEGAFVYAKQKTVSPKTMTHIYKIAKEAGLNPKGMCEIDNSRLADGHEGVGMKDVLGLTKMNELLGIETVFGEELESIKADVKADVTKARGVFKTVKNIGEYVENPRRHGELITDLRRPVSWPEETLALVQN